MRAKIYQPARNAMQSGEGGTKNWVLKFDPAQARRIDPLMGWTGSGDMQSQVKLSFESREAAESFAKANGIEATVVQPARRKHIVRKMGYGENFSPSRRETWTH